MFLQEIRSNNYEELRSKYKNDIDIYNALYRLKPKNDDEIRSFYTTIKTELIESIKCSPQHVIKSIFNIIPYNNRSTKLYLKLSKFIYDYYHITEVRDISLISNYLFYKEYGIKLDTSQDFKEIESENLDILAENTIYRAIMDNDLVNFISFTERSGFNNNQKLKSSLFPETTYNCFSLLELCCYYGAVDCFKLLRSKFNSEITETCVDFSFLSGNPEIMSECQKCQYPDEYTSPYVIISHNIDFVTYMMNEFYMEINLEDCAKYNNLEAFLVHLDITNDVNRCFINSIMFEIPSLCEYFLLHGADINGKDNSIKLNGMTALHVAACYTNNVIAELLISHGANINQKDSYGRTALHYASDLKHIILFLLQGANINEKDNHGKTALHLALSKSKETIELLIAYGANINEKDNRRNTALYCAVQNNYKESAELLLLYGASINEKNDMGKTVLHYAAQNNYKEIVELLLSHGANINEKDNMGKTALHIAAYNHSKELYQTITTYGEFYKNDKYEKELLQRIKNNKVVIELLLSHGANINEKDNEGQTPYQIAVDKNKEAVELFVSRGVDGKL